MLKPASCALFVCMPVCVYLYLVHQQLGHLHVVVEGGQVQRGVTIVLLLIYDPGPWQLGQQHAHSTAPRMRRERRERENKVSGRAEAGLGAHVKNTLRRSREYN